MPARYPKGRLSQAYYLLFQAVTGQGLEGVAKAAYTLFQSPVLMTDQYFQVTAMYPNEVIGEREWDYIFEKKQLNRERVWAILDEFLSGKADFYEPFYANTGPCKDMPRIFGELVTDNQVSGHVMIFLGKRPLKDDDFKIVELILNAANLKLESRIKGMSNWNLAITTKLEAMLDPKTPPHLKRLASEALTLALTPEYAVLVTPVGQQASQKAFAEFAVSQLNQMYRNVIAIVFQNTIVTLFGEVKSARGAQSLRPEMTNFVGKLFDFFEGHEMKSALSNRFFDMNDLYISYRQAFLTAKITMAMDQKERAVFMDYMPTPIFLAVLETEQARTFVHPVLHDIREYDTVHGTEYYKTLRAYSMAMHNRDITAERLSIHKNTLQYRLTRIGDLFELPFEEERMALNLLCGFLLMEIESFGTQEQRRALLEH